MSTGTTRVVTVALFQITNYLLDEGAGQDDNPQIVTNKLDERLVLAKSVYPK